MKRSSALIGTAAAAAVLVAGSVAALSAINTAAGSAPAVESVAVVDDQPVAAGGLTPIDIAPLPEIMPGTPVIVSAADTAPANSSPSAKSGGSSAKSKDQAKAPSSAAPIAQEARSLSAAQAGDIVMSQVDGKAEVTDISRTDHGGYDSWAVTVDKADGSRLVGYVFTGATGSEVFDWKVLKEPKPIVVTVPAPNQPASAQPTRGYDDHESDEHESHEGDHDDD